MRPHSIPGLLLLLARRRPKTAWLAAAGLVALGLLGAQAGSVGDATEGVCRLEQGWSAGPPEDHEALMLFARGAGLWASYDRDGEARRVPLRWRAEGTTLAVRPRGGDVTRVGYRLAREGPLCVLTLDAPPLPGARRTEFSARAPQR